MQLKRKSLCETYLADFCFNQFSLIANPFVLCFWPNVGEAAKKFWAYLKCFINCFISYTIWTSKLCRAMLAFNFSTNLKEETCLLLLWEGLLGTLHTLCYVYLYNVCGKVSSVHIFMGMSRDSKTYLMTELCSSRFEHFDGVVAIYT